MIVELIAAFILSNLVGYAILKLTGRWDAE